MDNKDLITRFAEDCFRFEALHQEIDGLIAEADSEVLAYEYEDLANQAAEIVLKLSANGNNVGENFYRYYVERLEYIIDYFRALLDYEETPLAEDEQDELDDEPDTSADEAADDTAAGAPSSEVLLPPDVEPITERTYSCWEELTSEQRAEVRDTCAMWDEMSEVAERDSGGGDSAKAAEELDDAEYLLSHVRYLLIKGYPLSLIHNEQKLRKRINKAIDAIPGFRESEKFKKLIELYPTYKEIEQ